MEPEPPGQRPYNDKYPHRRSITQFPDEEQDLVKYALVLYVHKCLTNNTLFPHMTEQLEWSTDALDRAFKDGECSLALSAVPL